MKPELRRIGAAGHRVVVVDGFSGDIERVNAVAAALAPFPPVRDGYYPGLRRVITRRDADADVYVERTLQTAAPFIAGAFDCRRFDLIEASFSMVTTPPDSLSPPQRGAHFDSADPDYLAVMHYLTPTAGTAFFRQRSTGVEQVTTNNLRAFVTAAQRETIALRGYIAGSNTAFEEIARVEGVPDRLVIYQGALLHSGIITADANLSADPREGRVTANFFIQLRR